MQVVRSYDHNTESVGWCRCNWLTLGNFIVLVIALIFIARVSLALLYCLVVVGVETTRMCAALFAFLEYSAKQSAIETSNL